MPNSKTSQQRTLRNDSQREIIPIAALIAGLEIVAVHGNNRTIVEIIECAELDIPHEMQLERLGFVQPDAFPQSRGDGGKERRGWRHARQTRIAESRVADRRLLGEPGRVVVDHGIGAARQLVIPLEIVDAGGRVQELRLRVGPAPGCADGQRDYGGDWVDHAAPVKREDGEDGAQGKAVRAV